MLSIDIYIVSIENIGQLLQILKINKLDLTCEAIHIVYTNSIIQGRVNMYNPFSGFLRTSFAV